MSDTREDAEYSVTLEFDYADSAVARAFTAALQVEFDALVARVAAGFPEIVVVDAE